VKRKGLGSAVAVLASGVASIFFVAPATVASAGTRHATSDSPGAAALPSIPWGIDFDNGGVDPKTLTADIQKVEADDHPSGTPKVVPPLVDVLNNMLEGSGGTTGGDDLEFPTPQADAVFDAHAVPMLTTQWDCNMWNISSGRDDQTLTKWATAAAAFGHTILIRPWRELNGTWYPWGIGAAKALSKCPGDSEAVTPAEYRLAWQHAYKIIHKIAPKVLWVWNVYAPGSSDFTNAYPGDRYVDYISFDSYVGDKEKKDWSDTDWSETQATYNILAGLGSQTKPIMVAEFSILNSASTTNSWIRKPERKNWITHTFKEAASEHAPNQSPRIKSLDWFDGRGATGSPVTSSAFAFDFPGWTSSQTAFDTAVDKLSSTS
jgi:Glycosyl hydrolase family 26